MEVTYGSTTRSQKGSETDGGRAGGIVEAVFLCMDEIRQIKYEQRRAEAWGGGGVEINYYLIFSFSCSCLFFLFDFVCLGA